MNTLTTIACRLTARHSTTPSRAGRFGLSIIIVFILNLSFPLLTLSCLAQETLNRPGTPSTPNIIVIMADDLGYGDLSCYGATNIQTPNIDRLAASGVRFTDGYCSASTCTPTRYSMLTGNYAFRTPGKGIAAPNSPALIPPGTETVASILQRGGYQTGVIGKWHLGLGPKKTKGPANQNNRRGGPDWNGELKPGPLEIGFDTCFLLPTTNDRVPQVYVEDHLVANLDPNDPLWVGNKRPSQSHPTGKTHRDTLKLDWSHGHNATIHNGISRIGFYTGGEAARFRDEDLADMWVKKSVEFLETNQNKPFFLFFASHDLHVPRMPHERFQGKSKLGLRGDSILQLDWSVGELTKTLQRLGIEKNTLVIFCSDNGPVMDDGYLDGALEKLGDHRAAGPFSGGKYSIYEGGTRTPFISNWPGTIAPQESSQVVCTVDLAASFAKLINQPLADKACIDSFDVLDAILGKPNASGRQTLIQQDNGNKGSLGFRKGNWKLLHHDKGKAFNLNVDQELAFTKVPKFQLFNLTDDPSESNNVIGKHPQIAAELKAQLAQQVKAGRTRPVQTKQQPALAE